jgi:hypothetical protein
MKNQIIIPVLLMLAAIYSCSVREPNSSAKTERPSTILLPEENISKIQQQFPHAMPYAMAIDSILAKVASYGIQPQQILWGHSTCVDDIIHTKNKLTHPEIKGPFTFGGLAGLPFTGVSGVAAFSHHVPENGTSLLLLGPHIGYNTVEGWGQIIRHGQDHTSTCCGALVAALNKLKKNEIKTAPPTEDDYQEQTIEQVALLHKDRILNSAEPLITLTHIVSDEALKRMTSYAHEVKQQHFLYAVVVVVVIINTDHQYSDYLWIDHIAIKDIKKGEWIRAL